MEPWKCVIVLTAVLTVCCGINAKGGSRFKRSRQYCPGGFYYVETTMECCPCSPCPRSSSDWVVNQCLDQYKQGIINDVNILCESFAPNGCWDLEYAYEYMKRQENASTTTAKSTTTKLATTTTTKKATTTTVKASTTPKPSPAFDPVQVVVDSDEENMTKNVTIPINNEQESWIQFLLVSVISIMSAVIVLALVMLCYMKFEEIREFYRKCRCRTPDPTSIPAVPAIPVIEMANPKPNNRQDDVDEQPTEEDELIPPSVQETTDDFQRKCSYTDKPTMEYRSLTNISVADEMHSEKPNKAEPFNDSIRSHRPQRPNSRSDEQLAPVWVENNNGGNIYVIQGTHGNVNVTFPPMPQPQPELYRPPNHPPPNYQGDHLPSYRPPAEHFRSTDYNSDCSSRQGLSNQTTSTCPHAQDEVRTCQTFPMRNEDLSSPQLHSRLEDRTSNNTQRVYSPPVPRYPPRPSETSAKISNFHSDAAARHYSPGRNFCDPQISMEGMPEMLPSCSGGVSTQVSVESEVEEDIYSSSENTTSIKHPPDDSHRPEQ